MELLRPEITSTSFGPALRYCRVIQKMKPTAARTTTAMMMIQVSMDASNTLGD